MCVTLLPVLDGVKYLSTIVYNYIGVNTAWRAAANQHTYVLRMLQSQQFYVVD